MNNCQVFTPNYIVEQMLNLLDWAGDNMKTKTIFEPSFGDGAFLTSIVERILHHTTHQSIPVSEIHKMLDNIYGIEIDKKYYDITINKLNNILHKYGIEHHEWKNLICGNTLHYKPPVKFDLCIANPPYQRITHIDAPTRKEIEENYQFGTGNTDLYIVFFEYCLKAINQETGKMCFITPNSYFKNTSQMHFRKYLSDNNLISYLIDYSKVKVFGEIATYTAVVLMDYEHKKDETQYTMMKGETEAEYTSVIHLQSFGTNPWVFTKPTDISFLKEISERKLKLKDICEVQHGIATNADKVYIVDKDVDIEQGILRPVIKASTLKKDKMIIFPYEWCEEDGRYVVIPEEKLISTYPKAYQYLCNNREILERRDMDKNNSTWYQYARSQGIQNSRNKKFAVKHILGEEGKCCEFAEVDEETLVYSGIYVVANSEEDYKRVKRILMDEELHKYLFMVGKDMAGGYRNVSAKFIKNYGIHDYTTSKRCAIDKETNV